MSDHITECVQTLRDMQFASDAFYRLAQKAGHHQFIEFTGLLNEYIKLCDKAVAAGEDFRNCDLIPESFHVAYVLEKLDCIFGKAFAAEALRQGYRKQR